MRKFKHIKEIIKLGLPMMIGSVLQILMNTMDMFFVSRLGTDQAAASSMGTSIAGVVFVFSMLVSSGAIALVARNKGAGDGDAIRRYTASSTLLAFGIGILLSILSVVFVDWIIGIYKPDMTIRSLIKAYVEVIFAFTFVVFINTTIRSVVQSTGDTRNPLIIFGTANIINIVLDYIFIVKLDLGIRGAAIATVTSQTIACLWLLKLVVKKLYMNQLKTFFMYISLRLNEIKNILQIGVWACIQSVARPITGLIMMRIVYSVGGSVGSAAFGIGLTIVNYFFIVLMGLTGAVTILVGQKIGERNIDEAKAIVNEGVIYSLFNFVLFAVPFVVLTPYLFAPFKAAPEVVIIGSRYLRIVYCSFILMGFTSMYRGAFSGSGDTYPPMVAALFANVICKLGFALLFTRVFNFGIDGIWIAIAGSVVIESIVLMSYYKTDRLYLKVIE